MNETLLNYRFMQAVERLPDKLAVVDGAARVTYAELLTRVQALARALCDDGVMPGDRVIILLESSVEFAIAVHAVLAVGAVFVPLSGMTKSEKLAFVARDTGARAVVTHAQLASIWLSLVPREPDIRAFRVAGESSSLVVESPKIRAWPSSGSTGAIMQAARIDQDLAALIYTSGTTGIPKGVMLTHLNMRSAWNSVQAYLGYRESDVIGLALPVVFSYGLYNMLMGLGLGATVVMERSAAFPIKPVQRFEQERVTVFPGVPTLFAAILQLQDLSRFDLRSVRIITNAAAALPEAHLRRLRAAFPAAALYSMYGQTECMRISYLPPEEVDQRSASVGKGIPNQDHWLIDESGVRLPNGSVGELVVRGTHVTSGYWARPGETAERIKPGAIAGQHELHTGDIFRTDADGYLYFVSRKDDIIKSRGEKVAPREVENVIYQLEAVAACAVVGVADDALGQSVKAYVVLRAGHTLTARDVIKHCMGLLESYMAPSIVEFVDDLPRTESGKIRHQSLRSQDVNKLESTHAD